MLMLPFNRLEQPAQKVDICFHNCMVKLRSNVRCLMLFYLVRLMVVAYQMVQHLRAEVPDDDGKVYGMFTVLYCILLVSNIATLVYARWLYVKYITNINQLYHIAQLINHSRLAQQPSLQQHPVPNPSSPSPTFPNLLTSTTVYQFQNNILATDIDQEYRLRSQRNCTLLINQQLDSHQPVKCWGQFFNLCSIAVFVYAVVLLAQGKGYTDQELGFVVCYLVTEVLTRFFIYLVLVIVGLLPVVCIGVCVYSCFCKKKTVIELPQVKQATMDTVKECQGNCPICYQDVQLNQKVIVLSCSPKHVFHELCIKGWTQLGKDTCPVCRALI